MRLIALSEAQAGDVIAEPVMKDRGMVILPKGALLSDKVIDRLRNMNVSEVVVEGDDPNAPPPKTYEELVDELEDRFSEHESDPTMMAIKEKVLEHLDARFEKEE